MLIAEPLYRLGGIERKDAAREKVERLADFVGLPRNLLDHFSTDSLVARRHVGIALDPKLVILDEPMAALDMSVQAIVLNLLSKLKASLGMSYLFVSHDLLVVRLLCDGVMVMPGGQIVEEGATESVMGRTVPSPHP